MGRIRKKIVKLPEHCATVGEYEKEPLVESQVYSIARR